MTTFSPLSRPVAAAVGVYTPQQDSRLLVAAMQATVTVAGRTVLDLCTGSGVVAIAAAEMGAARVSAFDVCPQAVACARRNVAAASVRVDVRRGALAAAAAEGPYGLVVSNPPYVPADPDDHGQRLPEHVGPSRAWDAGPDGRLVLDPLCDNAPGLLAGGGVLLLVQSEFADPDTSLLSLRRRGLDADVVLSQTIPFGPVLTSRAQWMERSGLLEPGRRDEEIVVIRAEKR